MKSTSFFVYSGWVNIFFHSTTPNGSFRCSSFHDLLSYFGACSYHVQWSGTCRMHQNCRSWQFICQTTSLLFLYSSTLCSKGFTLDHLDPGTSFCSLLQLLVMSPRPANPNLISCLYAVINHCWLTICMYNTSNYLYVHTPYTNYLLYNQTSYQGPWLEDGQANISGE